MKISAVIVSRGDVELGRVLGPILKDSRIDEVTIRRGVGGVWERWDGAVRAKNPVVYTQDDDCTVDVGAVLDAYEGGVIACNMPLWKRPEYPDGIALVGWGAVFHKSLLGTALGPYWRNFPSDALFMREADRVVTGLSKLKLIDVPFEHLPWAHGNERMGRERQHGDALREIRKRIALVRN